METFVKGAVKLGLLALALWIIFIIAISIAGVFRPQIVAGMIAWRLVRSDFLATAALVLVAIWIWPRKRSPQGDKP